MKITKSCFDKLIRDAGDGYPNLVCGFLIGQNDIVKNVIPIKNIADDPEHIWEMSPEEHYRGMASAQDTNKIILGVYHSASCGQSRLGASDIRRALMDDEPLYPDYIYIVVAPRGDGHLDIHAQRILTGGETKDEGIVVIADDILAGPPPSPEIKLLESLFKDHPRPLMPPPHNLSEYRLPTKVLGRLMELHEKFAKAAGRALSDDTQTNVILQFFEEQSVSIVFYYDYILSMPEPSLLMVGKVTPGKFPYTFEIDIPAAIQLTEHINHHQRTGTEELRKLTDIEQFEFEYIFHRVLYHLNRAWNSYSTMDFEDGKLTYHPQQQRQYAGDERMLVFSFEIGIGTYRGAITYAIPLLYLTRVFVELANGRKLSQPAPPEYYSADRLSRNNL